MKALTLALMIGAATALPAFAADAPATDAIVKTYGDIALAAYSDALTQAGVLDKAVDALIANPTNDTLKAARVAWQAARVPYQQTEAFRFGNPVVDDWEGDLNAWPLDESYIDYVQGNPNAGVINSPAAQPVITKQVLIGLNELFSEQSIFTGYHAIEFLLWGQDHSATGPGDRPYTDYVTDGSGTAANQDRRGQYLRVCAELLLDNLAQVRDEWTETGVYRQKFLYENTSNVSLGLVFTGLKEFAKTELSGERMFVAISTHDQEHEHSCFSDNTHNDLRGNIQGIVNVFYGKYKMHMELCVGV